MKIIIDKDNGMVYDENRIYEVTGYSEVLGYSVTHDTYNNGTNGKTLSYLEEDYIRRVYYTAFISGMNDPKEEEE